MTYGELISKATVEQRKELRERIEKIIGTKEWAKECAGDNLSDRINAASKWDKAYEGLAKVFLEHGEKALAMNFIQLGGTYKGVTANGKTWILERNNGYTQRSRYCGTLYIEGIGTVFTSGKLDKVFDYILNN